MVPSLLCVWIFQRINLIKLFSKNFFELSIQSKKTGKLVHLEVARYLTFEIPNHWNIHPIKLCRQEDESPGGILESEAWQLGLYGPGRRKIEWTF